MKISKLFIILFSLISLSFVSCSNETNDIGQSAINHGHMIYASIDAFDEGGSRATYNNSDDSWTLRNFSYGDLIGFYSAYGNNNSPGGNGAIVNVPMEYASNSFKNDTLNCNPDNFVDKKIFYYYPYHENIDYDADITSIDQAPDYGVELRVKCDDGYERCRDVLYVFDKAYAASQNFSHAMSSIVILRGNGFDKAEDLSVKIVLNKGVSHFTIRDYPHDNHDYYKVPWMVYLDGYEKTEKECRIWNAWKGAPYQVSQYSSLYPGELFETAYYIVLPTMDSSDRLTVEYIELFDDNGKLQKVSNFNLHGTTRTLDPGARYPLLIKMNGIEPVVYPFGIERWNDDVVIEENRAAGINNLENFTEWVRTYLSYLDNKISPTTIENLLKFGDKTEVEADGSLKWTFYLNSDIDFSSYQDMDKIQYIFGGSFEDCLEGNNHTLSNIKITNSASPSFLMSLASSGVIRNLKFKGLRIECTESQPVGGIVGECYGIISNCDVDGIVISNGPVGMIAAKAQNAILSDCVITGLIEGASTVENGLFAESSGSNNIENVKTAGLVKLVN